MNISVPYEKKGAWLIYTPYPQLDIEMSVDLEHAWKFIFVEKNQRWNSFYIYSHVGLDGFKDAHPFPQNWFMI